MELSQLEALCERLYNSQDSVERAHAENALKCFSVNTEYISQCQYILDNALTPYALMLASSSLLKQVTEHSLTLQLRLDIRNYVINYLATRGPKLESFVTASLIQLLCRVTKFGWFDDDKFKDVVKESTNFLSQGSPDHFAIGLKILNQLVSEMNQATSGLPSTHHRRVACSFRDQSLFQIFQISLTSLRQLKSDVVSRLQELALSLSLKCLSFDFVGTSIDESSDEFGTVQIPSSWKSVLEDPSTLQIFFDYYGSANPPLSKEALECLARLASIRRSLFTNDAARAKFLDHLMKGTQEILQTGQGLADHDNYHKYCRLLGRFRVNYQVAMRLELRCPQNVQGIKVDPEPDWNFDSLLSEIEVLEKNLSASAIVPVPFAKTKLRNLPGGKNVVRSRSTFVMRLSDEIDEIDDLENESSDKSLVATGRFACDDIYISDSDESSDEETSHEAQFMLMDKAGSVEGGLFELNHEHELMIKDDIRNCISNLEMDLMAKSKKSASALVQIDKYGEARREVDRKHDTQYQRKIAEALDNHLTAVQRDHELKFQIEERKLRNDAAFEEARRKERFLQEERLRQEKSKMEAEMQAKIRYEEAKRAALDAEKRAAKEAAERSKQTATEIQANASAEDSITTSNASAEDSNTTSRQSAGSIIKATQNALEVEKRRLQKLTELYEKNNALKLNSNEDFSSHVGLIGRLVRQIRGIKDNVSTKSRELIKILNDPQCPQSVSIAAFANKVVFHCESPNDAFACGHVIVHFTAQVPHAMDILLAEFHRACIYTVPKHIVFSKTAFQSKDAHYKAIGFQEVDGKLEDINKYLKRLESYMKQYGALVQTEVPGVQNPHGLEAGWAWLARLLNGLPPNIYAVVALNAFLQAAGYALHKKYRSQFRKMLNIISEDFLTAVREQLDPELKSFTLELQAYRDDKKFLEEPEGRALQSNLLSPVVVEQDHQQSYQEQSYYQPSYNQSYHQQSRYY